MFYYLIQRQECSCILVFYWSDAKINLNWVITIKILVVVEDEYHLSDAIRENLKRDGDNISLIGNVKVGYLETFNNSYDLIILAIIAKNGWFYNPKKN